MLGFEVSKDSEARNAAAVNRSGQRKLSFFLWHSTREKSNRNTKKKRERHTEPGSPGTRMVRAPIPTPRLSDIQTGKFPRNKPHVCRQRRVDIVGVGGRPAPGGVARHVLVEEGEDGGALGAVGAEDVLRAEQAALLAAVPVELDGILGREVGVDEDAEGLEEVDGGGAVVVGSRGAGGG